ncbi:MAG TPA: DNA repair protein RecN [Pyrinomonadaceae bacterium]|jgi:DNA repair protein RecN (Recombination protein N)|nr:DNA repair protein RecN [Pyrinomonadaceae bacterium]
MLALLNISNFALIKELRVEFDRGLNLLTGETGSGKSIIVDALGLLVGGRFSSEMVKAGESHASVEGLFSVGSHPQLQQALAGAGLEVATEGGVELVIRREFTPTGRGKIFINNRLATLALLRELRPFLVDIHGQGDQQTLFDPDTHLELLDAYAGLSDGRREVAALYKEWSALNQELRALRRDEAEALQLIDALRFQIEELAAAKLEAGEDARLEEERRRLSNMERLSELCAESLEQHYEEDDSTAARLGRLEKQLEELKGYESSFGEYLEGARSARALVEDFAATLRGFADGLNFSPQRLAEVENRLAEIARLKRKYGGTVESAVEHLARSRARLDSLESSDERAEEVSRRLAQARAAYLAAARRLGAERRRSADGLRRDVERALREVAMENARFVPAIDSPEAAAEDAEGLTRRFTAAGVDRVEFNFSANPGEPPRPLAKVASGGEASRLMLVLKTITNPSRFPRSIVFDEIDTGIGGRVSEAVGLKLKALAGSNQVLCVTHQAQIARFADTHLRVDKRGERGRTVVRVQRLDAAARVEEIARMLTGARITDAARRHAREMLKAN